MTDGRRMGLTFPGVTVTAPAVADAGAEVRAERSRPPPGGPLGVRPRRARRLRQPGADLPDRGVEVQALQGLDLLVARGRDGRDRRGVRVGQVDAARRCSPGSTRRPPAGPGSPATTCWPCRAASGCATGGTWSGFVRQQTARNLVPYLTAAQMRRPADDASPACPAASGATRVGELLEAVGVGALRRPPARSRCPAASSSAWRSASRSPTDPRVLLADEPTGELDSETAQEVFDALRTANRELGATVVVVTHDAAVSGQVARTVAIRDGRTSSEVLRCDARRTHGAVAEEYAVMDRAGRVQVPREYREALALTRRVRLALEPDHVVRRGRDERRDDADRRAVRVRSAGVDRTYGSGPQAVHALRGRLPRRRRRRAGRRSSAAPGRARRRCSTWSAASTGRTRDVRVDGDRGHGARRRRPAPTCAATPSRTSSRPSG